MSYTLVNSLNKKKECTCSDCGKYTGTYIIRARLLSWKCGHTFTLEFFNFKNDGFETVIEKAINCCDNDLGFFQVCERPGGEEEDCTSTHDSGGNTSTEGMHSVVCVDTCPTLDAHFNNICPWDDGPVEEETAGADEGDDAVCYDCENNEISCYNVGYKLCCEGTPKQEKVRDCEPCPDDSNPAGCEDEKFYTIYCEDELFSVPALCDCYDDDTVYVPCEFGVEDCEVNGEPAPCLNCLDQNGNEIDPIRSPRNKKWECPCFDRFGQKKSRESDCYCQERIGNYTDHLFKITSEHLDEDCQVMYRLKPFGGDITAAEPEACEISCNWDYTIVWQIINSENNLVSWFYTNTRFDVNFPETKPSLQEDADGLPTSETWPTFPLKNPPARRDFGGAGRYGCCGSYAELCS